MRACAARPVSARDKGTSSLPVGIDPYRTTYGISEGMLVVTILGVTFGTIAAILALLAVFGVLH